MSIFLNNIENEINILNQAIENDFTLIKSKEIKQKVDIIAKKIDHYLNETRTLYSLPLTKLIQLTISNR